MVLSYEIFRGTFASWDTLFSQAAAFAERVERENVLTISHSCDEREGVVVVWYWVA